METQKRQKLKERFRNGALPTQDDFAALIDSFVQVDEFAEWTQQGSIELGGKDGRRWRLAVPDGENLTLAPLADAAQFGTAADGAPNPVAIRLSAGTWLAISARRGTYSASATPPREATLESGPPGPLATVPADAKWHAIVTGATESGAYEIVARTAGGTSRSTFFERLAQATGLRAPASALLHGIAVDAGNGALPNVRSTVSPARPLRSLLALLSLVSALLGVAVLMYAAYLVPSARCPEPWGASCIGTLVEAEAGYVSGGTLLLVLSVAIAALLWLGRGRTLTLEWRKASGGTSYDLCVRGASVARGLIYYHITRLW